MEIEQLYSHYNAQKRNGYGIKL